MKKAFCDGWDNLFHIAVLNIAVSALCIGAWFLIGASLFSLPLSMFVFICCVAVIMILLFAVNECMAAVAAFKSFTFKDIISAVPSVWKDAVLFGLLVSVCVLLVFVGLPFYLGLKNVFGVFFAAIVVWAAVIAMLSLQWFMPIRSQLKNGFRKCLKKSFIIFFDNPGFSLFMFVYNTVLAVLSFFVAFLIPGYTGIILALNDALHLRLYKYDWMEEHPELTPKEARRLVPWDELIAEDRETLGPRSLKSFIFPWKD